MTDKELEKSLDEIKDDLDKIKNVLRDLYPHKTREELIKIGKHDDLTFKKRYDDKSGK